MIVNTGLLLRKPGESSYCRYRRLLISNFGAPPNKIKGFLAQYFQNNSDKKTDYYTSKFVYGAAEYENEIIKRSSLNEQQYNAHKQRYRPQKHCNSCASLAYHTDLFDLTWLDSCPIHNEKLVQNCNSCGQVWPTASELFSRYCHVCGIKSSIREIKYIDSKEFEKINELIHFIDLVNENFPQHFYLRQHHLYSETGRRINRLSPFLLLSSSSEFIKWNKSGSIKQGLLSIPSHMVKNTYQISYLKKEKHIKIANQDMEDIELKTNIYKQVFKKLSYTLFQNTQHRKCLVGNNFSKDFCLECYTLRAWAALVDKDQCFNKKKSIDFFPIWQVLHTIYGSIDRPDEPDFYRYLSAPSLEDDRLISLPIELSALIYKHDLWTTSVHVYNYLKRIKQIFQQNKRISLYEIYQGNSRICLPINSTFHPYLMQVDEGNLSVYYPDDLFESGLNINRKYNKLLR